MAVEYRDIYRRESDLATLFTANQVHERILFYATDGLDITEDVGMLGYTDNSYTKAAPNPSTNAHFVFTLDYDCNPQHPIGENGIHFRHSSSPSDSDLDLILVDNLPGDRSAWPKLWWDYSETSLAIRNYRLRLEYDALSYCLFEMEDATGNLKLIPIGDCSNGMVAVGNITPETQLDVDGGIAARGHTLYLGQSSVNGSYALNISGDFLLQYRSAGSYSTIASFDSTGILNLPSLTASRLIASDGSKDLVSSDLDDWIADEGTGNIVVTDDGSGGITLDTAQDILTSSSPVFAGLRLSGVSNGSVVYANGTNYLTGDVTNFCWNHISKRLGIGTLAPQAQVHIRSAGYGTYGTLYLDCDNATLGGGKLEFQSNGTAYASITGYRVGANDGRMLFSTYNGALNVVATLSEIGWFGIGLGDADADELLHLKGDGTNGAMIKFANSSNYVGNIGIYNTDTGSLSINRDIGGTRDTKIYDGTTNIALGITGYNSSVDIRGFTQLGSSVIAGSAVPIKTSSIGGTTASATTTDIAWAGAMQNIISINGWIAATANEAHGTGNISATYNWSVLLLETGYIRLQHANAALQNKAYTIWVVYTE